MIGAWGWKRSIKAIEASCNKVREIRPYPGTLLRGQMAETPDRPDAIRRTALAIEWDRQLPFGGIVVPGQLFSRQNLAHGNQFTTRHIDSQIRVARVVYRAPTPPGGIEMANLVQLKRKPCRALGDIAQKSGYCVTFGDQVCGYAHLAANPVAKRHAVRVLVKIDGPPPWNELDTRPGCASITERRYSSALLAKLIARRGRLKPNGLCRNRILETFRR